LFFLGFFSSFLRVFFLKDRFALTSDSSFFFFFLEVSKIWFFQGMTQAPDYELILATTLSLNLGLLKSQHEDIFLMLFNRCLLDGNLETMDESDLKVLQSLCLDSVFRSHKPLLTQLMINLVEK